MKKHNLIMRKASRILSYMIQNEPRMREKGLKIAEIAFKTNINYSHVSNLIRRNTDLFTSEPKDRSNYIRLTALGVKVAKLCYQIEILIPTQ